MVGCMEACKAKFENFSRSDSKSVYISKKVRDDQRVLLNIWKNLCSIEFRNAFLEFPERYLGDFMQYLWKFVEVVCIVFHKHVKVNCMKFHVDMLGWNSIHKLNKLARTAIGLTKVSSSLYRVVQFSINHEKFK